MRVGDLAVNGRFDQPLGVDDRRPLLSWRIFGSERGLRQAGYQIHAAANDADLRAGRLLWDSGEVVADQQGHVEYGGGSLSSGQRVRWRVRVWDTEGRCSGWSEPAGWEMGLLDPGDWGAARWIEHPWRADTAELPLFARRFVVDGEVGRARLYLAGLGVHEASLNGHPVTDEVLAPGNSNYQRSVEYRTYDVTNWLVEGSNTVGVRLGHGTALVSRAATNPGVGRSSVYSWWVSSPPGSARLLESADPGARRIRPSDTEGFAVGATVNIGTDPESRRITEVSEAGIGFEPPLTRAHESAAEVTASGRPVADLEPNAGTAVSPRLIAKLVLEYRDGRCEEIGSDRDWRCALGPFVTDNWFSGTDYDARREQVGWDAPEADLSYSATRRAGVPTGWVRAKCAPPPNLSTELVCRAAEPVRVIEECAPISVSEPKPGTWVFDLGQNIAGWPELRLASVPEATTITLRPAESLHPDGTVDQRSIHDPERGGDIFHTYTAWGCPEGERWRPSFQYFAMRYLEVTGFPTGYRRIEDSIAFLRVHADVRPSGGIETSCERINRIHRMVYNSVAGNMLSVLTDCPGREKLPYGADYTQPMSVLMLTFDFTAYLRTMQRHLLEGQSKRGNVALKAPVYDWGYAEKFGDEINWGNAIILLPWLLYENYGDTRTMANSYPRMREFLRYITTSKAGTGEYAHIVTGPLGDWVADEETSGDITGTWGYYLSCRYLAKMAALLGCDSDAIAYHALADDIAAAFHARFFHPELGCYTGDGTENGASQAAQAFALDADLVPEAERPRVLDFLVRRVYGYQPHGGGPHLAAGHLGLGPLVRALTRADRDDVLWDVLAEDTRPSYGYFLRSTPRNPDGLTTIPEQWDMRNSLNHMILTQIEEWFRTGLAGIRQAPGSVGYQSVIVKPKVVGDLDRVRGWYDAPAGRISANWSRSSGNFALEVTIPPSTAAEIWVPGAVTEASTGVPVERQEAGYTIYRVESGEYAFRSSLN